MTTTPTTPEHDARIAGMTFAAASPHDVAQVETKGRTAAERREVLARPTGHAEADLRRRIRSVATTPAPAASRRSATRRPAAR